MTIMVHGDRNSWPRFAGAGHEFLGRSSQHFVEYENWHNYTIATGPQR